MLTPQQLLKEGIDTLGLSIDSIQQQQLLQFLDLLNKWNQAFNLTAIKGLDQMVIRHLLDSLSISQYLYGERIIDVGTGGGLPGIPLSITHPQKFFCLLDSNQKKQIFVNQVVKSLSLTNVQCVTSKVERFARTSLDLGEAANERIPPSAQLVHDGSEQMQPTKHKFKLERVYQAPQKFSTILTRAFAPLDKMIGMTSHLLAQDGRFVAMMGKVNETLTVPPGYCISQLIPLDVPFEKGERHVAIVRQSSTTPKEEGKTI